MSTVTHDCNCAGSDWGTYEGYAIVEYPFFWTDPTVRKRYISVHECLVSTLQELWSHEIKTGGCCCGHNKIFGNIVVESDSDIVKMIKLGYEIQDIQRPDIFKWPKGDEYVKVK